MNKTDTDKYTELVKSFQKGDKKIFNKIIHLYQNYVFQIAYKYLKTKQDAEDLTQEVFIKLYKNLNNFKFHSNLKTYIYRIIINEAYNYYKKENKPHKRTNSLDDTSNKVIDEMMTFDDKLIEKELILNLEKSVLKLSEKYKAIIELKDFQNLSYKEIGKKIKITENAAKLRHHHALKELKKIYLKHKS